MRLAKIMPIGGFTRATTYLVEEEVQNRLRRTRAANTSSALEKKQDASRTRRVCYVAERRAFARATEVSDEMQFAPRECDAFFAAHLPIC
jgi:hypothetical protein